MSVTITVGTVTAVTNFTSSVTTHDAHIKHSGRICSVSDNILSFESVFDLTHAARGRTWSRDDKQLSDDAIEEARSRHWGYFQQYRDQLERIRNEASVKARQNLDKLNETFAGKARLQLAMTHPTDYQRELHALMNPGPTIAEEVDCSADTTID